MQRGLAFFARNYFIACGCKMSMKVFIREVSRLARSSDRLLRTPSEKLRVGDVDRLVRSLRTLSIKLSRRKELHRLVRHNAVAILADGSSFLGNANLGIRKGNIAQVRGYLANSIASLLEARRLFANPHLNKPHELVDAREFFSDAVESIRNSTNLNGVPVSLELHDSLNSPAPVELGRDGVRESLRALIHNAVQATLAAGHYKPVVVRVGKDGKHVVVRVVDEGTGVPKHVRPRLFEQKVSTKGKNGNGIGLLGVKDVAEHLHDGKVFWSSEKGKGSEFGFKLPLASAA